MVDPILLVLGLTAAVLGVMMAVSKSPITSAFSLVGLMVALGAIYGVIGAHFVAALQVLVYAGAIMVLFVFSIMLLNMNESVREIDFRNAKTWLTGAMCLGMLWMLYLGFRQFETFEGKPPMGEFTLERIKELGGNLEAVSGLLFSKYFFQFEIVSFLILVAIMAALTLAKRKVD